MKKLSTLLFFLSCSLVNQGPTGSLNDPEIGQKHLMTYEAEVSMNLLILIDLRIAQGASLAKWEQNLQYFIWKMYKDFNLLVALSSLDNRYDFIYASNKKSLTPKEDVPVKELKDLTLTNLIQSPLNKPPGIQYAINKLKFLSSRGFFNKNINTTVLLITAEDDNDFKTDMKGVPVKDNLQDRIQELKTINKDIYTGKLERLKFYNFEKLRFVSVLPNKSGCQKSSRTNYRYRLASQEIYEHFFSQTPSNIWPDNYDYCTQSLESIFDKVFRALKEKRFIK